MALRSGVAPGLVRNYRLSSELVRIYPEGPMGSSTGNVRGKPLAHILAPLWLLMYYGLL